MKYNPAPLRASVYDTELMESIRNDLTESLLIGPLFETANQIADRLVGGGVDDAIAMLAAITQMKAAVDVMAQLWAGEALHDGLPRTAIAEALGYASSSNLKTQMPAAGKFRDAIAATGKTGEPVQVQVGDWVVPVRF